MGSLINRYRALATTRLVTDYDSAASVRQHNWAADEMRRLVEEPGAVSELIPLLNEPSSARWLAFQLVEAGGLSDEVLHQCLEIVRMMGEGSDAESLAARIWLREQRHVDRSATPDGEE